MRNGVNVNAAFCLDDVPTTSLFVCRCQIEKKAGAGGRKEGRETRGAQLAHLDARLKVLEGSGAVAVIPLSNLENPFPLFCCC